MTHTILTLIFSAFAGIGIADVVHQLFIKRRPTFVQGLRELRRLFRIGGVSLLFRGAWAAYRDDEDAYFRALAAKDAEVCAELDRIRSGEQRGADRRRPIPEDYREQDAPPVAAAAGEPTFIRRGSYARHEDQFPER